MEDIKNVTITEIQAKKYLLKKKKKKHWLDRHFNYWVNYLKGHSSLTPQLFLYYKKLSVTTSSFTAVYILSNVQVDVIRGLQYIL